MTPTFQDFFKSFYYSNTYVPPVDLSDEGLAQHLLKNEDAAAAGIAQRLISEPNLQQVLSEPLSYDLAVKVPQNVQILENQGFKMLSSKPALPTGDIVPFYSVIEHDELRGWIIKSGANRVPTDQIMIGPANDKNEMAFFTEEEGLLRIEMAKRIAQIARESNIEVVIPKKKLVTYANLDGVTEATKKYCVVCEKIEILSVGETVEAIRAMDQEKQREIAKKITTIVQKVGLVDASFDNIRLTPDGKIAIIDTEPAGLMIAKKPGLWNRLFARGASVEKCARIGLFTLMTQVSKVGRKETSTFGLNPLEAAKGFEVFHKVAKEQYETSATPQLSKWKIALSILSLGLIPLINAIAALLLTKLTKDIFAKLQKMDADFGLKTVEYLTKKMGSFSLFSNPTEIQEATKSMQKEQFFIDHQKKRTPIAKRFFSLTDGVPYKADVRALLG